MIAFTITTLKSLPHGSALTVLIRLLFGGVVVFLLIAFLMMMPNALGPFTAMRWFILCSGDFVWGGLGASILPMKVLTS